MNSVNFVIERSAVIILLPLHGDIVRRVKYKHSSNFQLAFYRLQGLRQPFDRHCIIDRLSDHTSIVLLIRNIRQILHHSLNSSKPTSVETKKKKLVLELINLYPYEGTKARTFADATCSI